MGALGDETALPALETFTRAAKNSPERQAAERAVAALRAARKPNDEWKDLRTEVLDLKKDNREIKQQLEELKKKLELPGRTPDAKPADKPAS